jgi:hypothetical protein
MDRLVTEGNPPARNAVRTLGQGPVRRGAAQATPQKRRRWLDEESEREETPPRPRSREPMPPRPQSRDPTPLEDPPGDRPSGRRRGSRGSEGSLSVRRSKRVQQLRGG